MLGCNNPGVGVGAENIWGELGGMPFHFRPEEKGNLPQLALGYTRAVRQ